MAKTMDWFEIQLRTGVNVEDFERFMLTEYLPAWAEAPGIVETKLLKGWRGEREGRYAYYMLWESIEAHHKIWAPEGGVTELGKQLFDRYAAVNEKGDTFIAGWLSTDYVIVGE